LLIVGFDYFKERASFFRSNLSSATNKFNKNFYQVSLAHAIHSSSNAPVNYFDSPAAINISLLNGNDKRTTWFWDGAVSGFNNPIMAGLIEAMTNNYANPKDYCILSIGTGTGSRVVMVDAGTSTDPAVKAIYTRNKNNPLVITDPSFKFMHDVKKMASSILGDPPDSATFIAYSIVDSSLSNTANIVRINPTLAPVLDSTNWYDLPAVYKNDPEGKEKFEKLLEMDMDAVLNKEVDLITDLCDKFIVNSDIPCLPNQLIRGDVKNRPLILGEPTYREAKAKWLANCM
jgi:hypothetical protein